MEIDQELIDWCVEQRAQAERLLEGIRAGNRLYVGFDATNMNDITDEWREREEANIARIDRFLETHGAGNG